MTRRRISLAEGCAVLRTNWRESVDRVEKELSECLAALDRYERSFHTVLNAEPVAVNELSPIIEGKITGWSERLATAGERVVSVERLIAEQEAVWERWQSAVVRWKETIQQHPMNESVRE